jgi:hypothetical protein
LLTQYIELSHYLRSWLALDKSVSLIPRNGVVMDMQRIAFEILAEAVCLAVGTGFVHTAITTASETLGPRDCSMADRAFEMLMPNEAQHVRLIAIKAARNYTGETLQQA